MSVARRVAARLFPRHYPLSSDLASVPLDDLLRHYYTVWLHLHDRINQVFPNIKLQRHGIHSFYDFVSKHIDKSRPARVLDIGAGDCYLEYMLSEEMDKGSHFDCVDIETKPHLYLNSQIKFVEKDVFSLISENTLAPYDYAIASGFLGLLAEDQKSIVFEALRSCRFVFIRENPKMTNLIDAFSGPQINSYRPWPNTFTERELKEALIRHDFEILALEHEYDIYIFAVPLNFA